MSLTFDWFLPTSALAGSHAEVADRIEEYAALGIPEFIGYTPVHPPPR